MTRLVEVPAQFDDRSFNQFAAAFAEALTSGERLLFDAHAAEWASPYGLVGLLVAGAAARRGGGGGGAPPPPPPPRGRAPRPGPGRAFPGAAAPVSVLRHAPPQTPPPHHTLPP